VAEQGEGTSWKPALVEIEDALVPAFIIEVLDEGLFTVFVPSVPTPLAGAIYILEPKRVHPLDVPFTHAIKVISRWGFGAKELVRALNTTRPLESENRVDINPLTEAGQATSDRGHASL
jgi:uncharacterized membrane protein